MISGLTILSVVIGAIVGITVSRMVFPLVYERFGDKGILATIVAAVVLLVVLLVGASNAHAGGYLQLRLGPQVGGAPLRDVVPVEGEINGRITLGYRTRWQQGVHGVIELSHRSSLESSNDDGQDHAWIGMDVEF